MLLSKTEFLRLAGRTDKSLNDLLKEQDSRNILELKSNGLTYAIEFESETAFVTEDNKYQIHPNNQEKYIILK